MNKRQKKKEFKKVVGKNPPKGISIKLINFLIWAAHPSRIMTMQLTLKELEYKEQQKKNLENFNRIITERNRKWKSMRTVNMQ